jgi:hypothetical protein
MDFEALKIMNRFFEELRKWRFNPKGKLMAILSNVQTIQTVNLLSA